MTAPPITLRQITAAGLADLQALYDASPSYFISHSGAPAAPDQAAVDYDRLLDSGDRALLGIYWRQDRLIGFIDLRLHHPQQGVAWFGALVFGDETPGDREDLATWSARILEEWLRIGGEIEEIRTAVLLSDRSRVRFWVDLGYHATPQSVRRNIAGHSQRFVIYAKAIDRS